MLMFSSVQGQNVKTYIPEQARQYFPLIKSEQERFMPELQQVYYIPALIEQESCISLKHSKCFNPRSQLKTKREEGAGLSQITRAYREDGSLRFDSLEDLKRQYHRELKELSWSNVYTRPDLQIRTLILLTKNNYKALYDVKDSYQRIVLADPAYNGGLGGLQKERRVCGMTRGCNPNVWFDNVENYCMKSKKAIYGNRNACDINREHVTNIFKIRMNKYVPYFE